jgi:hypothetical protein
LNVPPALLDGIWLFLFVCLTLEPAAIPAARPGEGAFYVAADLCRLQSDEDLQGRYRPESADGDRVERKSKGENLGQGGNYYLFAVALLFNSIDGQFLTQKPTQAARYSERGFQNG